MSHTPEPWQFKEQGDADEYCIITAEDPAKWVIGFRMNGELTQDQQRANMRRIIACVNACKGISTENMESMVAEGATLKSRAGDNIALAESKVKDLRLMLANIGVVGEIDSHDVIRRESVLEITDRFVK